MGFSSNASNEILSSVVTNLQPAWGALHIIAYVFGFSLMIVAVVALIKAGEKRSQSGYKGAALAWLAGTCLMSLPSMLDILSMSVFQHASRSTLAYSPPSSNPDHEFILFAVTVIILLGLYAVISGFGLLKASADDSRLFWKAIRHIVGGIFCVNIIQTLHMIGTSLGPSVQQMTHALIG